MEIRNEIELNQAILMLEMKQQEEISELKLKFNLFTDQLNPISILTQTFEEISSYPNLKQNLVLYAKEKVATFVVEKFVGLKSKSKLMGALGSLLKFTVEQFVLKGR